MPTTMCGSLVRSSKAWTLSLYHDNKQITGLFLFVLIIYASSP
jgi:hypothetical protein